MAQTKVCSLCKKEKAITDFFVENRSGYKKDARRARCKKCHHQNHSPATRKKRELSRLQLVQTYKDKPCADCGVKFHPICMDFHHVRGKKKFVLGRVSRFHSIKQIKAEIAKCILICANCHRLRTFHVKEST